MRDRFLKQTSHEYSPNQRLALLAVAAPVFIIILPLALIRLGGWLDGALSWPALRDSPLNAILGGLLILTGGLFALWSIYVQFTLGRGTPAPVMATQDLIVRPPYSYCRNPMALGTIVAYLGVSVVAGSPGAALLAALGAVALLTYIRLLEEKEMAARFGEAYLAYRRRVPFIVPRLRRRG